MRAFLQGVRDAYHNPHVMICDGFPDAFYVAGFGYGRRLRGVYDARKRR